MATATATRRRRSTATTRRWPWPWSRTKLADSRRGGCRPPHPLLPRGLTRRVSLRVTGVGSLPLALSGRGCSQPMSCRPLRPAPLLYFVSPCVCVCVREACAAGLDRLDRKSVV